MRVESRGCSARKYKRGRGGKREMRSGEDILLG